MHVSVLLNEKQLATIDFNFEWRMENFFVAVSLGVTAYQVEVKID